MPLALKKMLGSLFIFFFLLAWIVVVVTVSRFIPRNVIALTLYYAIGGIGWAFPLMPVLKWMETARR